MQYMLDICDSYAVDYDVKFNCEKSAAPRTGPRHCYSCAELTLSCKSLVYATSIKYLGVYVTSAKRFKCSYDYVKLKFYQAFDALYYHSRCSNSDLATVEHLNIKSHTLYHSCFMLWSRMFLPSRFLVCWIGVLMLQLGRFLVSWSDNCAFIRVCLGLYHTRDFVRKITFKFMNKSYE